MTFVRVSGQAGNPEEAVDNVTAVDNAVPEDPILMLDQDQITKLENVLRSEEAKDFLGEVLSNPGSNPNESLGDFLTPAPETVGPPPPLIPNDEVKEQLQQEQKTKSNRRKSQRQLDRELKEEAEKIRKENQKMLKKEKEAMRRQSRGGEITPPELEEKSESIDTPPPTPTAASTRYSTMGQKSSIYPKIHIFHKIHIFKIFIFHKNSQFQSLIFHKIHFFSNIK